MTTKKKKQSHFSHALRFAKKRYRHFPNVLGVGVGSKYKRINGVSNEASKVAGVHCIQFFVSKKQNAIRKRNKLPSFIYDRFPDGSINFFHKIPTDVIVLGAIHAACGAGDQLDSETEHGLITLIFIDKSSSTNSYYLISCAHVAGNMQTSPPANNQLTSNGSDANPFATTVVNSVASQGEVSFDIALANIANNVVISKELIISGQNTTLNGFFPKGMIQTGMWVDATLRNGNPRGSVESLNTSASITYSTGTFTVHNLYGVNVNTQKGDSGGLVYHNSQAVGIVVAASAQGWLWFQPLESAFAYLQSIYQNPIEIFPAS